MIHIIKQPSVRFLSAGVVLLASLIACGKTPVSDQSIVVSSASAREKLASPVSDARIIIFSASATEKLASHEAEWEAPFWEPSSRQILRFEAAFPEYLRGNPTGRGMPGEDFKSYGRQYFGISKNGKRLIYLNAFCGPERFPNRQMYKVWVLDGGKCYFHVIYNPAENKFSDLQYNGEA
ncbi:MAG: hypothetical protein NTX59_03020 [Elusimicrobia bacterium]|nr:hypothetical protein [Elusimicrobiota bacterium]